MTKQERLARVEKFGQIKQSDRDELEGLHFCPDWDYLAVYKDMPEYVACACPKF